MSSNNALKDEVTLHQIFIQRYSKGESIRLLKHLKRMSAKLKKSINSDYNKARAVDLALQLEQIAKTYLDGYGDDLIKGLREFGIAEGEFARSAILATTSAEAATPASYRQIQAVITRKPMILVGKNKTQSLTINQAVKTFSKKRTRDIGNIIKDGATAGKTSVQIINEITEIVGGKFIHQAAALVKTTTNHMGAQARAETYAANDDVIIGETYLATLDDHTTIQCAGFDGETFGIGQGPMPPIHWGCRSLRAAKVNPKYDLGSEIVGKRATIDGPVSGRVTYGGWLKRQSLERQIEVLGVTRAKLFRSGKISISNFSDDIGRVYDLKQLGELNPKAFKNSASSAK